jgi:hypothetical protein
MTDPVAEAAAQLAAQQAEPTMLEKAMDTIHDLEAKVEHLIHPDAPGNEPAVAAESATVPAIADMQQGNVNNGQAMDVPNQVADLPNVASVAAEPTTAAVSASNADGADITKSTGASSGEPLHVRIAAHLEAIYSMAKEAPAAAMTDTSALKTHVGDILHRISNGMAVTEGELVQKLEALYRML